ncbi:hypothetical protein [Burkholderia sp. 572]|uniref:hypothetical protein n=1 Tax=Burkholderia sp. 572 TaxID=3156414 RepID=UPI003397E715
MSDINAAPSTTEPSNEAAKTDMQGAGTAAVGESSTAAAQPSALVPGAPGALSAQPVSDMQASVGSGDAVQGDDPNAAASPAAGQSASDTASSAQDASLGGDTAADALRAEIASLQQQLTDTHAEVAKWQGLYNAATAAKPHAQSLLQKLEAGEAIVMGDLQSRLRAFVDAL